MSWRGDRARVVAGHRPSHAELLRKLRIGWRTGDLNAVVVPTNRPAAVLSESIALAGRLGCPILVLGSGQSMAETVGAQFGSVTGAVIRIPATLPRPLLELLTQQHLSHYAEPFLDTGNKRNIALLLGRLLGWRRVLFLDDDVRGLPARRIRRAALAMVRQNVDVVGWPYRSFPDNSIVCHAARSAGLEQDVFPGGGALLVDVTGRLPFFPAVYNEDWLFVHDHLARRRVAVAGEVRQLLFDPFDDPYRARQQEFGDVLAEGLFELIHQRRSVLVGCLPSYWQARIINREQMLTDLDRRLWRLRNRHTRTRDGYEIAKVLRSLDASREALTLVNAQDLAEFTSLWRFDLFRWNARLHQLGTVQKMADALERLGIQEFQLFGAV